MTLERLMGLPTKQSLCLHSMYTYVATVVSPCGKSNVSVVGHQPRHVCKMLRHGPSCSRRGRPLCAAAHRAAPAVSSLSDSARRPLTVRRDWRGALQCLLSKARHHCTARLLLLTNWLFWGIFVQKVFATNLNFWYQQVKISLNKGNL